MTVTGSSEFSRDHFIFLLVYSQFILNLLECKHKLETQIFMIYNFYVFVFIIYVFINAWPFGSAPVLVLCMLCLGFSKCTIFGLWYWGSSRKCLTLLSGKASSLQLCVTCMAIVSGAENMYFHEVKNASSNRSIFGKLIFFAVNQPLNDQYHINATIQYITIHMQKMVHHNKQPCFNYHPNWSRWRRQ